MQSDHHSNDLRRRNRKEYLESLFQRPLSPFLNSSRIHYPSKWNDISPMTQEIKDNFINNYHPDQHANSSSNNHERKDHDSALIRRNEEDLELLRSGQLVFPTLYSKNEEMNAHIILTKEFLLKIPADAVVNSANEALLGGGGLDAIIHYYAGSSLKDEIQLLPNVPLYESYYYPIKCLTGSCVITSGHNLPHPYILHTVCPYLDANGQPQAKLLIQCYQSILQYLDGDHISSIVIGALGTGYYGYPMLEATILSLRVIREFFEFISSSTRDPPITSGRKNLRVILSIPNEIHSEMHEILWKIIFPSA